MKKPKISAIVSTYNSEEFMEGCLENLLEQTVLRDMEIIVIDSGSRQDEKSIVKRFMSRCPRIRYFRTRRENMYQAWNRAIRLARGRYITTANTDDRSTPEAYEKMAGVLDREKGIALVYTDFYHTTRKNDSFHVKDRPKKRVLRRMPDYSPGKLFRYNMCGPRPMYRKSVHKKIGYFDPRYPSLADYDFWLRMSEFYRMKRIPSPLTLYYLNRKGVYYRHGPINPRQARQICLKHMKRG